MKVAYVLMSSVVHLKSELRKSLSDDVLDCSKCLKILFRNFFISSLKLVIPRGIIYPRTCKVVTIIGLWYVLNPSRSSGTNGSS